MDRMGKWRLLQRWIDLRFAENVLSPTAKVSPLSLKLSKNKQKQQQHVAEAYLFLDQH